MKTVLPFTLALLWVQGPPGCSAEESPQPTQVKLRNVALGKPATQSSTMTHWFFPKDHFVASKATDGSLANRITTHSGSCSHTTDSGPKRPGGEWLRVDLQHSYPVHSVKLTNRARFGDRLRDFKVYVDDGLKMPGSGTLCVSVTGPTPQGATKEYTCERPVTGRYVTVLNGIGQVLTICELQVMSVEPSERLKTDIEDFKTMMKANIEDVKTMMMTNIEDVKTMMKTAKEDVKAKMKANIEDVKTTMKTDIEDVKSTMKTDIEDVKTMTKTDIEYVKTTMKTDIEDVKIMMKTDTENVKTKMETDIEDVKTTMKTDIEDVKTIIKTDIEDVKTTMKTDIEDFNTTMKTDIEDVKTMIKMDIEDVKMTMKTDKEDFKTIIEKTEAGVQQQILELIREAFPANIVHQFKFIGDLSSPNRSRENLALNKPATQSSTSHGGAASRAFDGNLVTWYNANSCTHTDYVDGLHWLRVDLQAQYWVQDVQVTNRGEGLGDRLRNFTVTVDEALTPPGTGNTCVSVTSIADGATEEYTCTPGPVKGRFVTLSQTDSMLTVCELQVFGKEA